MRDLLTNFRWQDGLDILIVTYVFYRLYLWLKRKRAFRMVLALLALPFFLFLAKWIDLPLSVWGLQNLWAVILLVLVVIFQQEIREVLRSFGLLTVFFGRPEVLPSKVLDRVVEAAFTLAEKGFGGLIVLQQGDDLEAFTHGKTWLDAEVNEDLLVSLFNPESPLHDGAVILQGDRIRCATALLPVSQSPSLPKQWGTRHRSGIGITEVSDAKCIIVSEERREVLLASEGKAERSLRKEALAESLSDLPSSSKRKEKKPWGVIFENLPSKVLFLLLVTLLWVFVIGLRQGEMSFDLPIEYYSIPNHLTLSVESPKEISVRLRGSQRLLSSLNADRLRVQVDLSNAHPGMNQVSLSEDNITVPSGIRVINFNPQKIRLPVSKSSGPEKNQ
jgi:diadenylate cyclase